MRTLHLFIVLAFLLAGCATPTPAVTLVEPTVAEPAPIDAATATSTYNNGRSPPYTSPRHRNTRCPAAGAGFPPAFGYPVQFR
jgi:hypothetical protein